MNGKENINRQIQAAKKEGWLWVWKDYNESKIRTREDEVIT